MTKPEPKPIVVLNILDVLNYLDSIKKGTRTLLWDYLINGDILPDQNSCAKVWFAMGEDPDTDPAIEILISEYPQFANENEVMVEVEW
jgi:hypothetical protein